MIERDPSEFIAHDDMTLTALDEVEIAMGAVNDHQDREEQLMKSLAGTALRAWLAGEDIDAIAAAIATEDIPVHPRAQLGQFVGQAVATAINRGQTL